MPMKTYRKNRFWKTTWIYDRASITDNTLWFPVLRDEIVLYNLFDVLDHVNEIIIFRSFSKKFPALNIKRVQLRN